MKNSVLRWVTLTAACFSATFAGAASADNYPSRPIHFVVPYAAGGGTDIVARKIASELSTVLGQQIVVENRPGASGSIGVMHVVRAKPDGYTMLITHSAPIIQNPLIFKDLAYNPKKDLAPVAELSRGQQVLLVNDTVPVKNLREFTEYAKEKGDTMAFASWGNGTVSHYAGEYLNKIAGLSMIHVPYQGTAPAMQDLLGNQVPASFLDPATVKPQVEAGKLKALAVAGNKRSPALPDTPTFKELGMPEMVPFGGWIGILAPAGTPQEIVDKMSEATVSIVKRAEISAWMNERGYVPTAENAQTLAANIDDESARWKSIFAAVGVEAQ